MNDASAQAGVPRNQGVKCLWPAAIALAGYWALLIYNLGAQWSIYEQYSYGWAVPFLCIYLIWKKAGKGRRDGEKCVDQKAARPLADAQRARTRVGTPEHFNRTILWSLGLCALLYAPTRLLHEANPIWRLTSWLWALEAGGITLGLLYLIGGRGWLAQFAFPVAFFLVAVPWPSAAEGFLANSLMRLNVGATVELLGMAGVPAVPHGNVIEVGTGIVGVDEACSGIRSFQATLMMSLFFGELHRLSLGRRAGLSLTGFALAFAGNVVRTTLLSWVAATRGTGAVAQWHGPAGVTILVVSFICLWFCGVWLKRKGEPRGREAAEREREGTSAVPGEAAPRWVMVSWCLLAWLLAVEAATEFWFFSHENKPEAVQDWTIKLNPADPPYVAQENPTVLRGQFRFDAGIEAEWRDAADNSWRLYYFRWLPAHSVKNRVAIQLAKSHGPETCLPAVGMTLKNQSGTTEVRIGDVRLAMQQYVFETEGNRVHVFYGIYEDVSGSAKLANRRTDAGSRVAAALAGSRNYGQRFFEVAVVGPEDGDAAKAALERELRRLIVMETPNPG